MIKEIYLKFKDLYDHEPTIVRSPGRVNLIGEHTDYNNGFVLPAAINKEIYFAIAQNFTNKVNFYSYDLHEKASFDLAEVKPSEPSWANYLLGVIAQFQQNHIINGFDLVFGGNIPIGAGLSSSAAVECGLAFALNRLYDLQVDKFDLVKMAQLAEYEYAGVRCGIMDQFASMFGRKNQAVKLDCRSLEYKYYNLEMEDYRIVLCDTQVKHSLASSEYNTRRFECENGVVILSKYYPQVSSLRDVTVEMLEEHQQEFDPVTYKRCLFVVNENNRVEKACNDLLNGDMKSFGQRMFESHDGLQHNYEVSCPELDFMVEIAKDTDGVLGSRMMGGGGFGGCTINLVKLEKLQEFAETIEQRYKQKFNIQPKIHIAEIVDGSSLVEEILIKS